MKTQVNTILPYPYNKAFMDGEPIDYIVKDSAPMDDKTYVKSLGYRLKKRRDCPWECSNLPGFLFTGDDGWGKFYAFGARNRETEIFLDMIVKGIIVPFRIGNLSKPDYHVWDKV